MTTLSSLPQIEREVGEDEKLNLFWDILNMGFVAIASFESQMLGSTVLTVQQFAEPDQFGMAFYPNRETEEPLEVFLGTKELTLMQLSDGELKSSWSFIPATETPKLECVLNLRFQDVIYVNIIEQKHGY